MKNPSNIQNLLNLIGAVLLFSIIFAVIIAGYNIAIGNFHQYVNL